MMTEQEREAVVLRLLGGEALAKKTEHEDVFEIIRRGIPNRAVQRIEKRWSMHEDDLVRIVGASSRTLARRRRAPRELLTSVESDRIYRFGRAMSRIEEVFDDKDVALDWVSRPNKALLGMKPIDILDTDAGVERVDEVLTRVEHGVYS